TGDMMGALVPETSLHLVTKQILDTASDTECIDHAGRHKSHDRPGRLRRRAVSLPAPCRIAVRQTGLTPPAIGVLLGLEPGHRTANIRLREVLYDCTETGQNGPCAINIIHAPPAIPTAVGLLLPLDKPQGRHHGWVCLIVTQRRKPLETASGQIRRARIKQGMVVGKGNIVEDDTIVVLVV